jgi:hypothetical protein
MPRKEIFERGCDVRTLAPLRADSAAPGLRNEAERNGQRASPLEWAGKTGMMKRINR